MSTVVQFVDEVPPEPEVPERGSAHWAMIAADLKSAPGVWAVIAEDYWTTLIYSIRDGNLVAFSPAGTFEARAVVDGHEKRKARIYARYVGSEGVDTSNETETPADVISSVRALFDTHVSPARSASDEASLRYGVTMFDAALRQMERSIR